MENEERVIQFSGFQTLWTRITLFSRHSTRTVVLK